MLLSQTFEFALEQLGEQAADYAEWLKSLVDKEHAESMRGPNNEDWSQAWQEFKANFETRLSKLTEEQAGAMRLVKVEALHLMPVVDEATQTRSGNVELVSRQAMIWLAPDHLVIGLDDYTKAAAMRFSDEVKA